MGLGPEIFLCWEIKGPPTCSGLITSMGISFSYRFNTDSPGFAWVHLSLALRHPSSFLYVRSYGQGVRVHVTPLQSKVGYIQSHCLSYHGRDLLAIGNSATQDGLGLLGIHCLLAVGKHWSAWARCAWWIFPETWNSTLVSFYEAFSTLVALTLYSILQHSLTTQQTTKDSQPHR